MENCSNSHNGNIIKRIWRFYYEGFRNMTVGRTLWFIILIKLFVIFAILKVFFFQPTLKGTDKEKADAVRSSLISPKQTNTLFLHP